MVLLQGAVASDAVGMVQSDAGKVGEFVLLDSSGLVHKP